MLKAAPFLLMLPLMAQSGEHRAYPPIRACGLTAHALFDGKPIGTLQTPLRENLLATLKPQIAQEAKAADVIEPSAQSRQQLEHNLLVTDLSSSGNGQHLFAVMWQEEQICGGHENCAWWLVREDGSRIVIIAPAVTGGAAVPTPASLSGWAAGLKQQQDGTSVLLLIASGFADGGGGMRVTSCKKLQNNQLTDTECSPGCDPEAVANQPDH